MKICMMITGLGVGGAENHLLKLLPHLSHEVCIISLTPANEIGLKIEDLGFKVYYVNMKSYYVPFFKIFRILLKEKPDVIDSYLIHANLLSRLFSFKCKIVNSVRNDYSDLWFLNFLDRLTRNFVNLWIPNNKALIPYLKRNGVSESRIRVLENGVNTLSVNKKYSVKRELGLKSDSTVMVCVARLVKQKNHLFLLQALLKLPVSYHLVLVGDGPERVNLEKFVSAHGLSSRVHFLGSRTDAVSVINSSDIFVLASFKEGMSNALLEAIYLGKRVLVSDIPANRFCGCTFTSMKDFIKKVSSAKVSRFRVKTMKEIAKEYEGFLG